MIGLDVALINSKKAIEDIGKCKNNMVSDGAGIRKEIMELANRLKNNDEDIYILPCNEFRDGFIPNSSVTSNEGVLLHTFAMQPRDSAFDDPSHTYPASLGHKNKTNMINEKSHINSINRLEDYNSPIKVFSKVHQTCISVVLLLGFISMDQIEKRSYTLFAGGNSKYGAMYGQSCNFEDIKDKLISCKGCERKLQKGVNNINCAKCYNWEINNSKYSKKVVDSIGGYRKKPFQLTMKMQEEESRKIFNLIVQGKLSVSLAKAQLQSICLPSEAITAIIDSAILKHAKETNTLDMHDLNGFHHLIDRSNINGIDFPDFAIYQRKNLTYDKLSGSPMHVLYLGKNLMIEHLTYIYLREIIGIIKSKISLLLKTAKLFNVHSLVLKDISSALFDCSNSGIDILPNELLKGDKYTSGWLATDFNKLCKFWCYVWRNMDYYLDQQFNNKTMDLSKYTSKMCSIYLKLCNQHIPSTLTEKRKAVHEHKQSMINKSRELKEFKVEPLVRTTYALIAQIMTSNEDNIGNLNIHYKQYMNELNRVDQTLKKFRMILIRNLSGLVNIIMQMCRFCSKTINAEVT